MLLAAYIFLIGVNLWTLAPYIGGLPILYVAQFLLGIDASTLGVTRAYIVETTLPNIRTDSLSRLSALQYAGFLMTPLFGSFLV